VIRHHGERAHARQSHTEFHAVAVVDAARLVFAQPIWEKSSLETLLADLSAPGRRPAAVTHRDMDVSRAFRAGASARHFPKATMCRDRFHLFALGNKALDEVRLAEVRNQPDLKATRWSLLENPSAWTTSQPQTIHWL